MQKAKWFTQDNANIRCDCCPHQCIIPEGKAGFCGTYYNIDQTLINQRYFRFSSMALDPIEKKPLYHFYPGSHILSLGGFGCNFQCFYCQNHSISQNNSTGETFSSEFILQEAQKTHAIGIALTYNEPLTNYETAYDLFRLCHQKGLKTVLVSNGFIQPKPFLDLIPYIDAINIDVKFFQEETYRIHTKGSLSPVLETLQNSVGKCHTEITYLVIPSLNDSPKDIHQLCHYIASLDNAIPLHFSAYYPQWHATIPATPVALLTQICSIASSYLPFVYAGNIPSETNQTLYNTYCPSCHSLWIERTDSSIQFHHMQQHHCSVCGETIKNIQGIPS